MDIFRLDGKVAVVTGGSRGLGRGIAIALAQAGAQVLVTSRSGEAPETSAAIHALGGRVETMTYHVGQEAPPPTPVEEAVARLGTIDILVNNAGIQRRAVVTEFSLSDWLEVLNVNLTAAWVLAQAAARQMMEDGGGKIINVASLLSMQGGVTVPAYTASKHGVAGLTKAMCNELAGHGINVNGIVPGYMATDMNTTLIGDDRRAGQILTRIPAGRWGRESDVAGAAVFLASPASDYVHGHLLAVDGGWLAR